MRPRFTHRLVNDPFGDPGLFCRFPFENRTVLFDLGDLAPLSARDLLHVTHVFVSHTHMDHFCGFDRLLRVALGRDKTLRLFGPAGFADNVRGKLEGYNWNLVHTYPRRLVLKVTEADGDRLRHHVFASDTGFRHTGSPREAPFDGRLWEEPSMAVHSAVLDHGTPCLAFALRERVHVNVMTAPLAALGLSPGPWLQELKRAIYENRPARTVLEVPLSGGGRETHRFTVGDLADRVVRITRGQSLAYVTDAVFSPRNSGAVTALARGVDHIYIEAAFMEADEPVARTKKHLTAAQAGTLAALAGARAFTLFHHSPRYQGRPVDPRGEAEAAYRKAGGGSDG